MIISQQKTEVIASIVLFNHTFDEIEPTLVSLLNEELVSKIVFIDNGGCSWASELDNIRVDYLKSDFNGGFGHGHNQAIKIYASKCDYFLICNPDIYFDAGVILYLIEKCLENDYRFVSPSIKYCDGSRQYSCKLLPTPVNLLTRRFLPSLARLFDSKYELRHTNLKKCISVPSVSGCFMLLRKDLLIKIGGFDERYFMYLEDVDFCRRALEFSNIIFCPDKSITHVYTKGSYKSIRLLCCHIHSAIKYFNKWGWFFDRKRKLHNHLCLKNTE